MIGYYAGTQNVMIETYGILVFKWRVVSMFSTLRSKADGNGEIWGYQENGTIVDHDSGKVPVKSFVR